MKTLTAFLLALSLSTPLYGQSNLPVDSLLSLITRQFNKQAQTFSKTSNGIKLHWGLIDYRFFPFGCTDYDFGRDSCELVWIWKIGPIIALEKSETVKAQVGVVSYTGEDKHPRYRTSQMFFYELNSAGTWFQYKDSFVQTQTWNDSLNTYICGKE